MKKLLTITTVLLLSLYGISSCKKDTSVPVSTIDFTLPQDFSLAYGETHKISLPENLKTTGSLILSLDFSQTQNITINSGTKLHDKLTSAITIDLEKQTLIINSSLLYPKAPRPRQLKAEYLTVIK